MEPEGYQFCQTGWPIGCRHLLDWLVNELQESSCLIASHRQQQIIDVCCHPWLLVVAENLNFSSCLLAQQELYCLNHLPSSQTFTSTKSSFLFSQNVLQALFLTPLRDHLWTDYRDDSVGRVFALKAQRSELNLQTLHKVLSMVGVHTYDPITGQDRQKIPGGHWSASPA